MRQSEEDNQDKKATYQSPVKSMFEKFASHKDVTLIYGDPITYKKQSIVPVAKMRYSFGAGGGGSHTAVENQTPTGHGEGGGGYFSVKPLGVYKITANRVQFKPAVDFKHMITLFSVVTLGMTLLLRKK